MNSELQERVKREQESHTEHDVLAENIRIKQRFSHLNVYPSKVHLLEKVKEFTRDLSKITILDYGCGRGASSLEYLQNGAKRVYGIDISDVYIKDAINRASELEFEENRYKFQVMDAHQLNFPNNTFDMVIGHGILHHLDASIALNEIYRVLKPDGRVLLFEPLADNPMLKIFRRLTPQARTSDESPFSGKEINRLQNQNNWYVETTYCGIMDAPVSMLTSIILPSHPENILIKWADQLEQWTHKHGILLAWNQYALFNMVKKG